MIEHILSMPLATFTITGIITAVVSVVSAGVSIYSSQQQAEAQEEAANYNARLAQDKARQEQEAAAENAWRRQKEAMRQLAKQRASLAAKGLSIEGTPLAVLGYTYTDAQMEIGDLAYDAANRSRVHQSQAFLEVFQGNAMANATRMGGYTQALGSVANAATAFAEPKKKPAGGA